MEKVITKGGGMAPDCTVRSQESSASNDSKDSSNVGSKTDSCLESKHSKEILLSEKHRKQQQHQAQARQRSSTTDEDGAKQKSCQTKDDSNLLMFTSCGQLLLGVILVVFGVLVLVHGASLGGSGAGLWAGAGALVAGALGVVATLATSSGRTNSAFSTAHLASSLVSLALSNMAAITALTAVVRDAQRSGQITLLDLPGEENSSAESQGGWPGLLASIGLLVVSIAELLLSGYTSLTLTPKLCGCLRSPRQVEEVCCSDGRLKTRNMVHQWVIAQNHVPNNKNQPIYVVQPVMPVHPMMQPAYAMPPSTGKYSAGFIAPGGMPIPTAAAAATAYAPVPVLPPGTYIQRPPSNGAQMIRSKHKRHATPEQSEIATVERKKHQEGRNGSTKRMSSIGEDQVDLAQTYTGLDKKISEEFISIAMDPDRKSKASSHHGSEIGSAKAI